MKISLSSPLIRALSALFINLSAAGFAGVFIAPIYTQNPDWFAALIGYLIYGIVFLYFSVKLEELIEL